jgi:uncharacterized protein YegP (UPF0339 family)
MKFGKINGGCQAMARKQKKYDPKTAPDLVEIEKARNGKWFYRIRSRNSKKLQHSETYYSKGNAKSAAIAHCKRHCAPVGYVLTIPGKKKGEVEEYRFGC